MSDLANDFKASRAVARGLTLRDESFRFGEQKLAVTADGEDSAGYS